MVSTSARNSFWILQKWQIKKPTHSTRSNSIYPAPWWSWCVTVCRLSTVSGFASSPHWQSRGSFGVPGQRSPSAGAAPHRLCRCRLPPRCPRGLGQGSNAAAAHVAKAADRSPSGRTVDSCGAEIVGRFNFSELPYNVVIFLINKNTPTFEVITISHHAFLLATSEAPAPFSFLFVFLSRNESEIVSSTSLHFFHRPEGLSVEPMSTTSPGPVEPRCLVEPHS